ncbi:MAG TPA: uroporphyrinogen-III synthase [Steroidobacteraceae bacterium]|nr:uroporphyrinogen-III synthase [Steroidobacteraceae bacterium]
MTRAAAAVVVTRDEPADGPLSVELRALGLEVLAWPVLRVRAPSDATALERALTAMAEFEWIVFASQHAVSVVTARLEAPPERARIAAVGARTAQALSEHGWRVDVVPQEASALGLVAALTPLIRRGTRVLFPASSRALPTLAAGLSRLGAEVCQVEAYSTDGAALDARSCCSLIERGEVGAVTFTSPSAVEELERALGSAVFVRLLEGSSPVTLGSTTAHALAARGFSCVLAEPATFKGLADTTYRLLQLRP